MSSSLLSCSFLVFSSLSINALNLHSSSKGQDVISLSFFFQAHDAGDFAEGQDVILTLADQRVVTGPPIENTSHTHTHTHTHTHCVNKSTYI